MGVSMPGGRQHDDDFTDADREAIAAIRRELDAEFGPLEPVEPLADDRSAVEPPPASRPPAPPSRPPAPPSRQPALPREPAPPSRQPAAPPLVRRRPARAVPVFLLGTLLGGAVGGVTGGLTTLMWLQYADDPGLRGSSRSIERRAPSSTEGRTSAPPIERGTPRTEESPAAATREPPTHAGLESALNEWLDATKAGDIERQMRFYPARVPVYYTWRNVTHQAVRAEKLRVFGGVTRLEITTDAPTIEVADGGDSAVSRFRKRYVIEGPSVRRRGEVLQELRWLRTRDGWRIVSERDAEVLVPSASVGPGTERRGGTIDRAR
jgi:hypothetical protein